MASIDQYYQKSISEIFYSFENCEIACVPSKNEEKVNLVVIIYTYLVNREYLH